MGKDEKIQGEGDKEAARRYEKAVEKTVESGKVEKRADERRKEPGKDEREAEREGASRAKEKDPNVKRDYDEPA